MLKSVKCKDMFKGDWKVKNLYQFIVRGEAIAVKSEIKDNRG